MMWTYIIVFQMGVLDEQVQSFLNNHPNVFEWAKCLPNSYFFESDRAAKTIADDFRAIFPGKRFILMDTNTDREGWLPKDVWKMIPRKTGPSI